MANLPSLKSLAELPDVPSPVLALVGAGDAAAERRASCRASSPRSTRSRSILVVARSTST